MAQFTHTRLIMELTALDRRNRNLRGWNPSALPQYFAAAESVTDAPSFADSFTPTAAMSNIAWNLGLGLTVDRQRWILNGCAIG